MMLGNSLPICSCGVCSQAAPLKTGAQHSEVATVAMQVIFMVERRCCYNGIERFYNGVVVPEKVFQRSVT